MVSSDYKQAQVLQSCPLSPLARMLMVKCVHCAGPLGKIHGLPFTPAASPPAANRPSSEYASWAALPWLESLHGWYQNIESRSCYCKGDAAEALRFNNMFLVDGLVKHMLLPDQSAGLVGTRSMQWCKDTLYDSQNAACALQV
jgi:hypothetical protein